MDYSFLEQDHLISEFRDLVDPGCTVSNAEGELNKDAGTKGNGSKPRDENVAKVEEDDIVAEKEEIARNPHLSDWFRRILAKQAPFECRISCLTNVAARSLARVLWSDATITALDVSNLELSDKSGAYLARALKNNKTLAKLEMDGNLFGALTVASLATSLTTNNTLEFLSMSSNLLLATKRTASTSSQDENCMGLLAHSITKNSGLTCLSLWRCGIGPEGGKLLCDAVSNNTRLISVEVGYNDFGCDDVARMTERLEVNRRKWRERLSQEAEQAKERERAKQDKIKNDQEKQKEEQNQIWLEEQKIARAEARRLLQEEEREEKLKAEEEKQQRERAVQREEERKAKSKKGKKGKKKGKK